MKEVALTIGNFDGVHLGHQALCARLKEEGKRQVIVTFANHPSTVLKDTPTPTLTTHFHKLQILKKIGITEVVTLPFTEALSLLSAQEFLLFLQKQTSFDVLILGQEARLGHKREAGEEEITALGNELGFTTSYIPPVYHESTPISSTRVRSLVAKGDLSSASLLLGRDYSLLSPVQRGEGKGKLLGFKTLNFSLEGLQHPPWGVYVVSVCYNGTSYRGVANLGVAPTLKLSSPPLMEVHLLDFAQEIYGAFVEVTFHRHLREERKFPSLEALKNQIEQDISSLSL